ncbi:MAG: hypothetical protein P8Z71_13865 [Candidatus Sulfobium sp.]
MDQEIEKIPPDIKLVGEAVVALNVSCRNVGIYPRNHPAVELSLNRAFDLFRRIFEVRSSLSLVVAEDTLVIDNYRLDRKNAAYRQFAGLLNRLNIVYVTFLKAFTKDELYIFQHYVSGQARDPSSPDVPFDGKDLPDIQVGFVDYKRFSVEEGKTLQDMPREDLWEMYIAALSAGTLNAEDLEELDEISAEVFSRIVNRMYEEDADGKSAERIFTFYTQRLFRRPFANENMKRLIELLGGLLPGPREKFLAVVADVLSKDVREAAPSPDGVSPDLVMSLIDQLESGEISVPESLRNLLDRLQRPAAGGNDPLSLMGSHSVDDIFLPSGMQDDKSGSPLERTIFDTFQTSASDTYQEEIRKLADFSSPERFVIPLARLRKEFDDDTIDKAFHLVIFEMMTSDAVSEDEYRQFIQTLREQTSQFMMTGQYRQVLQAVKLLRFNIERDRFADLTREAVKQYYSGDFFLSFIDSFRMMGSQVRDEAWEFCEFFGEMIVPHLINALANEDSKTFRSLLMGCLKQFGEAIVPDALKALDDSRWFVKRNMLSLLIGSRSREIIPHVRPYCRDENRKVSLEALKCLLGLQDEFATEVIGEYLRSGSEEDFELAIALAGSFRVRGTVADLVPALEGKGTTRPGPEQKLLMIRAMGNIGDPGCLDAFRKILSTKVLFFKKNVERMKEEIYGTLKKFSYEDVEDMVQSGLKSRNRHIREESQRLSRKGER